MMIPFQIMGQTITGVFCSEMPDMVLVKKDIFKKKYNRLESLENADKARIEERKKKIELGLDSASVSADIALAQNEELRAENIRLRELLFNAQNSNKSLLDKNNGFLVELNEQANQLSELQDLRKDKDMLMQVNKELADKVSALEGTISELQEQVRLMGREPVEVARASRTDKAIHKAAEVLVLAIRERKSVCDIISSYEGLGTSSIYAVLSVKKDSDYDRLMEIYNKESSYLCLNYVTKDSIDNWYRKERKAKLHLHTGAELEGKLGAGYENIKGVTKDPYTGYYRVVGIGI